VANRGSNGGYSTPAPVKDPIKKHKNENAHLLFLKHIK
jgi:hypothetical protein